MLNMDIVIVSSYDAKYSTELRFFLRFLQKLLIYWQYSIQITKKTNLAKNLRQNKF